MTTTGHTQVVALDAPDIDRLAAFYAVLAGWEIADKEPDWITLRTPGGREVAFQLAPDHVGPSWPGQEHPQQLHLDLLIDGTRRRPAGQWSSAPAGWPTVRPGSRWLIRPGIRSTSASETESDR